MRRFILCLVVALLGTSTANAQEAVSRIAFGSCARESRPQPIWDAIAAARPDVFIFLGDNIYGDTEDMAVMQAKYDQLSAEPHFAAFRATGARILGTWDDHDLGLNDAGADYPKRAESKELLMRFFGDGPDADRRGRDGVYDSYVFGPPGRRVQVILLDTRWFRSPLESAQLGDPPRLHYLPTTDASRTLLGDEQWAWLERRLREPADLRVIASSIQVLSQEHRFEKWWNFPHERERLMGLIDATRANGVVFVSGDRHSGEISRADALAGYPMIDVTASSLNQPGQPEPTPEPNVHRAHSQRVRAENFGLISVDWSAPQPQVRMELRGLNGDVVVEHAVPLSALRHAN